MNAVIQVRSGWNMASTVEVIAGAAAGIITALGTVIVARWQEESKRQSEAGKNKLDLLAKVDEMVDERVAELRADRDQLKSEAEEARRDREAAKKERNQIADELFTMQREIAVLKAENEEVKLHRTQAINRMREELNEFNRRNMALTGENAELKTQVSFLMEENKQLRQQINDLQQCPS